jgi:hypothetical protein
MPEKMRKRLAILGAGGIGKYHLREYKEQGLPVVAILGEDENNTIETASMLAKEFNVKPKCYWNIEELFKKEEIDAVSICTPAKFHGRMIEACLKANLEVFCEKPFVYDNLYENYDIAKGLMDLAKERKKIIQINTQWINATKVLIPHIILPITNLTIFMQPGAKGIEMMPDHLPHANSILISLCGIGGLSKIRFPIKSSEKNVVTFIYESKNPCRVTYIFEYKKERPRDIIIDINERKFSRKIGKNYTQYFVSENTEIFIGDPFRNSILNFIEIINGSNEKAISYEEILQNVFIQDKIIKNYL